MIFLYLKKLVFNPINPKRLRSLLKGVSILSQFFERKLDKRSFNLTLWFTKILINCLHLEKILNPMKTYYLLKYFSVI